MRLRKIKIRNIASLRGEHIVDFDEIHGQSALFAITGETGAGKSTILNSIGLALYGKYFKKSIISNDVVTLGEKEGSVELIFELSGKTYLSTWRIKVRKNNGEELAKTTPERGFFVLSGNAFEDSREPAPAPIEDTLSLDFEQFTKCVVLNQGEFAKFLMSSFSERRSILEKLCPGHVFDKLTSELNRELKVHQDSQRDLLNALKTLEGEGPVEAVKEEDLTAGKRELELRESWLDLLEKLSKKFETLSSYFRHNADYTKRISDTSAQISAETTKYNLALKETEDFQKLRDERETELKKREPRLLELIGMEENLSRDRKVLEKLTLERSALEKNIQQGRELLEKLSLEEKTLSEKKETLVSKLQFPVGELLQHRSRLESAFTLMNETQNLAKDIRRDQEKLKEAGAKGTELSEEWKQLKARLELIPPDLDLRVKTLQDKKASAEKASVRSKELEAAIHEDRSRLTTDQETFQAVEEKRLPLLSNIKIQELLSAVSVCVLHPDTENKGTCPVCETPFVTGKLDELRQIAGKFNAKKLHEDEAKLRDEATRLRAHIDLLTKRIQENETALSEVKKLLSTAGDSEDLGKELEISQKLQWERNDILPRAKKSETEVEKARAHYAVIREELKKLEATEGKKKEELTSLVSGLPAALTFTPENAERLKADLSLALSVAEIDAQMKQVVTKLDHQKQNTEKFAQDIQAKTDEWKSIQSSIDAATSTLTSELAGETATALHQKLKLTATRAREDFEKKETLRREQEKILRDFQRNLTIYQEQVREVELQYTQAHSEIQALMKEELPELSPDLTDLRDTFRELSLPLHSSPSLFIPLSERMEQRRTELRESTNEARAQLARLQTRKDEQEKRRDRIRLIELKLADVNSEIQRWDRLSKILGKDELRTFVLSLVEENLIIVTNEELARLCQGRYEIVHQTKSNNTPEFFILDKLRDGGIRKISTLSGGETFMVSLAMALGLAEMTRGTAEIDTLFIDEGFGTLDQDSLEDVLDMLNQIQNRGLMVGIISHVKALTSTLPVNLHVQKRQDGTSSVRLVVN